MNKLFSFLILILASKFALMADSAPVNNYSQENTHNHFEFPIFSDMPDAVYYDSNEMEIVIEAGGVSQYYIVEIIRDSQNMTLIST